MLKCGNSPGVSKDDHLEENFLPWCHSVTTVGEEAQISTAKLIKIEKEVKAKTVYTRIGFSRTFDAKRKWLHYKMPFMHFNLLCSELQKPFCFYNRPNPWFCSNPQIGHVHCYYRSHENQTHKRHAHACCRSFTDFLFKTLLTANICFQSIQAHLLRYRSIHRPGNGERS